MHLAGFCVRNNNNSSSSQIKYIFHFAFCGSNHRRTDSQPRVPEWRHVMSASLLPTEYAPGFYRSRRVLLAPAAAAAALEGLEGWGLVVVQVAAHWGCTRACTTAPNHAQTHATIKAKPPLRVNAKPPSRARHWTDGHTAVIRRSYGPSAVHPTPYTGQRDTWPLGPRRPRSRIASSACCSNRTGMGCSGRSLVWGTDM